MDTFDVLVREHEVITLVLDCFEVLSNQVRKLSMLDIRMAERIIEFTRGYTDSCHHLKEELYLFPLLLGACRDTLFGFRIFAV